MPPDKSVNEMLPDFNQIEESLIIPFLRKEFGVVDSAFFLYHAIDQCVDIYAYLVNGKCVIEFDLSKTDNTLTKNEIISVENYRKTIQGSGKANKNARDILKYAIDKF